MNSPEQSLGRTRGCQEFLTARDLLLGLREDYSGARTAFVWPALKDFNWVSDYFDHVARRRDRIALKLVRDQEEDLELSYSVLAERANQVANFLSAQKVAPGDRVLLSLRNVVPLWETTLAAIKLGAVIVPATTLLRQDDIADRVRRGGVRAVVTHDSMTALFPRELEVPVRIVVDGRSNGWRSYEESFGASTAFEPARRTRAADPLIVYFTSGTTSRPKLVVHTHASYPVGHLSTMYWLGLRPGDLHMNLSSPGWAKHAWSSFFAPWNAEATVVAYEYERFDPRALLNQLVRSRITTFCAPPTVWRMLVQEDLRRWNVVLREATSAGEPLNPEVIRRVEDAWGLTIRDGYGQTETSALIGNSPGERIKPGSMGRPLPGCPVRLVSADGKTGEDGEICLDLSGGPVGLMSGYLDDPERTAYAMRDGYYHTGDVATRDADGYFTYVGRNDDVFKSSDYRISPFELESVLVEHSAVMEAAVVPSPDPIRLAVPKAYVVLAAGYEANAQTAKSILGFVRARVSPYKRIRRIEFSELPKTISGKIRRVELRDREWSTQHAAATAGSAPERSRRSLEFCEDDFPDLKS